MEDSNFLIINVFILPLEGMRGTVRKGAIMSVYYYKTNGEEVKCVNCKNTDFKRLSEGGKPGDLVPYECTRCHFVSWFPGEFAPAETK